MKIRPGLRFRLVLDEETRARLHREGWAGCMVGGVEQADAESVTVRYADGQPWRWRREEFQAVAEPDGKPTTPLQ